MGKRSILPSTKGLSNPITIADDDLIIFTIRRQSNKESQFVMKYSAFKLLMLSSNTLTELTAGAGVTVDGVLLKDGYVVNKPTPVEMNVTATATPAQILSGYITSTSDAAVSITTPTATAIGALIGAVAGTSFDFTIDNSAGANTVTLILDASIAVVTPAITGGATLTVSTSNDIGIFRVVFTSATAAKIFRIA